MNDKEKEYITNAAISFNGKIYTGRRYCLIIRDIVKETGVKRVIGEQGFVTNTGRFVSREEGAKIAIAAEQIKVLTYNKSELFSEEIIP